MLPPVFGVLFDGLAYGMLLFLLSVGLSVTLGLMNFVNLAHCAFAMVGGYVTVLLVNHFAWPFLWTLPLAFLMPALLSVVFERVFYRRFYGKSDLDQVLLTIGIAFVSVAAAAWFFGTTQQPIRTPEVLRGSFHVLGLDIAPYRLFLIVVGAAITAGADRRAGIHALRRPGARRRRQPAHGERTRHQRRAHLCHHLRGRQRARGAWRRAGDRDRWARSQFRLHLSDLRADRGRGRRARLDRRLARRRAS